MHRAHLILSLVQQLNIVLEIVHLGLLLLPLRIASPFPCTSSPPIAAVRTRAGAEVFPNELQEQRQRTRELWRLLRH